MQGADWNDLRVVLALARSRTLAAAAKTLNVNDATVSRRLARIEARLDARLFERGGDGRLQPTAAGATVAAHAETMAREAEAIAAAVSGADLVSSGVVRLTAAPVLASRLLAPALPALIDAHPQLEIELIAEPRNLSLTRREADMALRLARPRDGGQAIIASRIGRLDYAVYETAGAAPGGPWISYEDGFAGLPQARWIAARAGEPTAALRVNDAETLIEAVAAGLGRSLLPRVIADRDPRLRRLDAFAEPVSRELWLMIHRPLTPLARIRAVAGWLRSLAPAS